MPSEASSTALCPYCQRQYNINEFTSEHVWPKMFGGHFAGDQFVIPVCKGCNSTCGLFVDAGFGKNFFVTNRASADAHRYLDLEAGTPMPLVYMGNIEWLSAATYQSVELWLSACKSHILHLHNNDSEKFVGYAGGNPIKKKRNRGTAIFINGNDNEKWLRLGLLSFAEHFANERRFIWGVNLSDPESRRQLETRIGLPPDGVHLPIAEEYVAHSNSGKSTPLAISTRLDFDQRFMAKVALGLGVKLLGREFQLSPWADILRSKLWAIGVEKHEALPGIGWSSIGHKGELGILEKILRWEGGIVIAVLPVMKKLGLLLDCFGSQFLVTISDDPDIWSKDHKIGHGVVWVLIPQRQICEGPISLPEFIGHRNGTAIVPKLRDAERLRVPVKMLRKRLEQPPSD